MLSPDDHVNVVILSADDETGPEAVASVRAYAKAVATVLRWDLYESTAETPATMRLRELARSAGDEGPVNGAETWLASAFDAPAWVLIAAALLAFAIAVGLAVWLDVRQDRVGKVAGIAGTALLFIMLLLIGVWRSRRRLDA